MQAEDEQANAASLDKQLSSLGACVNSVQQEAAAAHSISSNLQQRFAAMEWRLEQTASSCAATLRTMTAKHERLAGTLAVVKESANFSEANPDAQCPSCFDEQALQVCCEPPSRSCACLKGCFQAVCKLAQPDAVWTADVVWYNYP